jgi:site-specific DNA recombinase
MTATSVHRRSRKPPAPAVASPTVRVAIYCRKSVDKGNGGEFGSIEAQREAGEAYCVSQRGLGWQALPEHYDDLGYSGATTNRPAYQRLMADIEAERVDVVLVYKLDRMSRSQADVVRLLEFLDEHGVEIKSITQNFDTVTPMGRFGMGMISLVAQLEREQTAERVRDKIHASRRRGIWTGGRPLLGYDVADRKLVVNDAEAEVVRDIFAIYLQHGSLLAVVHECRRRGITNKSWVNQHGVRVEGGPLAKSTLRSLLSNPAYTGRLRADGELSPVGHAAIIDQQAFDAVQALLAEHGAPGRDRPRSNWNVPLLGLLWCSCGAAMTHSTTRRRGRTYSAFVCVRAQKEGAAACPGSRAPAPQMLAAVIERLRAIGRDPDVVARTLASCRAEMATAVARHDQERRQLRADRKRLTRERERLARDAPLASRLAEVDAVLAAIDARESDLTDRGPGPIELDEADLRAALARFDPIWEAMLPAEQARLLALLIDTVVYDARKGELAITFRPNGIRQLAQDHP